MLPRKPSALMMAGLLSAICISTYAGVEAVAPSAASGNRPAAIGGSAMPPATHLNPTWGTAADSDDSRRTGTSSSNPRPSNGGIESMRNGTGTSTGLGTGGGTGGAGGGTGRAGGGVGG